MIDFAWDWHAKNILEKTIKENGHIIFTENNRTYQDNMKSMTIKGQRRLIHHWLYICSKKLDTSVKLKLKNLCDYKGCIDLEHWVDTNDKDAIYKIGSYHLSKNSMKQGNCRLWTGSLNPFGYGYAYFNGKS